MHKTVLLILLLLPVLRCLAAPVVTRLDTAGDVGLYNSLLIGRDGLGLIAYTDHSKNCIKVLHCGNADCSQDNKITVVDSLHEGVIGVVAMLGKDSLPLLAIYEQVPDLTLKVLHCGNEACDSNNTSIVVDRLVGSMQSMIPGENGNPLILYPKSNTVTRILQCGTSTCSSGNKISEIITPITSSYPMVMGSDSLPIILFSDYYKRNLQIVHCRTRSCSSHDAIFTIDSVGDLAMSARDVAIGRDGLPIIVYSKFAPGFKLKVVHCGNRTCTSGNIFTDLTQVSSGGLATIRIGSDGLPLISFYDFNGRDLELLRCLDPACTGPKTLVSVDTVGNVGRSNTMVLAQGGYPMISYWDEDNQDLLVAHCDHIHCSAGPAAVPGSPEFRLA